MSGLLGDSNFAIDGSGYSNAPVGLHSDVCIDLRCDGNGTLAGLRALFFCCDGMGVNPCDGG